MTLDEDRSPAISRATAGTCGRYGTTRTSGTCRAVYPALRRRTDR